MTDVVRKAPKREVKKTTTTERAKAVFRQIDADGDGKLTLEEMQVWLEKMGEEDMANMLMIVLDTDGDGSVSVDEFVLGFEKGLCAKFVQEDEDEDHYVVCTASLDGLVHMWSASSGKLLHTLSEHKDFVTSVNFSPDGSPHGRRIVTSSFDKTVKVWDYATLHCVATLEGHEDNAFDACFTKAGLRIVSCSGDKTIKVWDAKSFQCVGTLTGHGDAVFMTRPSADGTRIVSASRDNTAKVWDCGQF